jgi:hypothetical protein
MTKDQAAYFIEGLTAGLAAPSPELAKALCVVLAAQYAITVEELDVIRAEVDACLDEAEAMEAKGQ